MTVPAKLTINAKLFRTARHCALSLLFLGSVAAAAAGNNLEEKMKYERGLEQKVEEVLANLLGPGKSRVMIRAALDFSSKESVENIVLESENKEESHFKWQDINKGASQAELLPGFPAGPKEAPPSMKPGSGKYQREVVFPQAMVKRLTVSLLLSEDLSAAEAQKVRRVVSDLLALDTARGDDILVMRARFTPIWYTSEMLGTLVKYGILAVIAIIGMGIVSVGFLKMASAMRTMAGPESTKIQMEMGGAREGGEDALAFTEPGQLAAPPEKAGDRAQPSGEAPDGVVFNVKADKLEILVRMLAKDEPADISLIAVHLPAALRGKFISMLPPDTAAEVFANIVKVRFVEPELLAKIKDGLEARLNGAVGGYEKALEMIEEASTKSKEALLKVMEKTHPEVAARVKSSILLLDDLEDLEDKDFAFLAGAVPVNLWAAAAWRLPEGMRARLKTQLTGRAWKIVEQTMSYGAPPEEKTAAAAEELLSAARKLISEGRIKKPGRGTAAIGFDTAAAPET